MKSKSFLTSALLLLSLYSFGQIPGSDRRNTAAELESAQTRPLIVMLETENHQVIDRLTATGKSSRIAEYRALVKKHNEDLKTAFTTYCYFTTHIEFKTKAGIDSLGNTDKYVIALFRTWEYPVFKPNEIEGNPDNIFYWLDWNPDRITKNGNDDRDYLSAYSIFELRLSEKMDEKKGYPLFSVILTYMFPSASDLVISALYTNGVFAPTQKESKKIITTRPQPIDSVMAIKTLLIPRNFLSPDLTPEGISTYYPYKYEVVEDSVFQARILENSGKYIFMNITPLPWDVDPQAPGIPNVLRLFIYVQVIVDPSAKNKFGISSSIAEIGKKPKKPYRNVNEGKLVTKESLKDLVTHY